MLADRILAVGLYPEPGLDAAEVRLRWVEERAVIFGFGCSLAFLAALAALGRADPSPEDLSALLDDCADGSCEALGLSQLRGELRQEVNATRQLSEGETEAWSEGGPVKCLCKDSAEMYFCAGSFEGLSKCYVADTSCAAGDTRSCGWTATSRTRSGITPDAPNRRRSEWRMRHFPS
ncbi:hypothetical protein AK812_SmicGene24718 [Symbiodinium microadriaticum]|uniref:Uncharacterized protein n=1 Tax=Symbiodinium microadriaticum TaxID=2951 RepID=A0A1Q9DE43_SYMMI|nr:hypothetical protein AK812_SmicGene24718 [Symbiodinium microadriaticum]